VEIFIDIMAVLNNAVYNQSNQQIQFRKSLKFKLERKAIFDHQTNSFINGKHFIELLL
jgi:hypothetical protein